MFGLGNGGRTLATELPLCIRSWGKVVIWEGVIVESEEFVRSIISIGDIFVKQRYQIIL